MLEQHRLDADEGSNPDYYLLQKHQWAGRRNNQDKSRIIYNSNLALSGISEEVHTYMLGSRSALEWIIDRYGISTHKASGIMNEPNDWGVENGNSRYIVDLINRITTVSVETMRIINELPKISNL